MMDMHLFHVESNDEPLQTGKLLIASPFTNDYHFSRAVVLLIEHNEQGSTGIVVNKNFHYHTWLNDLVPALEFAPRIPVYKGGPVDRKMIFILHTLKEIEASYPIGNGLYMNGDFEAIQQYILEGNPTEGVLRAFIGYAGWDKGQLETELTENAWIVGQTHKEALLKTNYRELWYNSLSSMGGKYALWARYPKYPQLN